ncbi:hypothetical protein Scep_015049 [Stephania cephalantha]|uniref:Uncharacterized protein n=1 Tax=Stephania cephalantha TaxID=152367 RepID=A0AAP0P115_9MAGN
MTGKRTLRFNRTFSPLKITLSPHHFCDLPKLRPTNHVVVVVLLLSATIEAVRPGRDSDLSEAPEKCELAAGGAEALREALAGPPVPIHNEARRVRLHPPRLERAIHNPHNNPPPSRLTPQPRNLPLRLPHRPLVGTLQFPLKDLEDHHNQCSPLRTLPLRRPSGRPQGKIRLKLALRDRPAPPPPSSEYLPPPPPPSYYYSSAPPPPPPTTREYRGYAAPAPYSSGHIPAPAPYSGYSDPYTGYYSGYYSHSTLPPPPPRPFFERAAGYGGVSGMSGPSAPVDYSGYEQKPRGARWGLGRGWRLGQWPGRWEGWRWRRGLSMRRRRLRRGWRVTWL